MKRKIIVTLLSITVLSMTACGQKEESAVTDFVAAAPSDLDILNDSTPDEEIEADVEEYSVKELCDLYLTGEKVDDELYYEQGKGWILIPGSEWTSYYPGAVYSDEEWTPEAVLQSYRDQTAPWVNVYNDHDALWSQDYVHRFEVDGNWFCIDKVRVLPLVEETHAISPEDVLQAYQSGEWDGGIWWSEDYSTRVRMNWDGSLEYYYDRYTYTEDNDPLGLAYTGYGELPDYLNEANGALFKSYGSEGITSYNFNTRMDFYPDLPNGHVDGMKDVMRIDGTGDYVVLDDSIELYYQGKLIQSWSVENTNDSFIAPYWEDGTMFVYTEGKVMKLLNNGKTEIVLNNVVGEDYGWEGTCYVLTLNSDDGLLSCHEVFSGEAVDIASDVVAVSVQDGIIFYEEANGSVYALHPRLSHCFYGDDDDDAIVYLGTEDVEFYIGEYDKFEGFFDEFVERYSSVNA